MVQCHAVNLFSWGYVLFLLLYPGVQRPCPVLQRLHLEKTTTQGWDTDSITSCLRWAWSAFWHHHDNTWSKPTNDVSHHFHMFMWMFYRGRDSSIQPCGTLQWKGKGMIISKYKQFSPHTKFKPEIRLKCVQKIHFLQGFLELKPDCFSTTFPKKWILVVQDCQQYLLRRSHMITSFISQNIISPINNHNDSITGYLPGRTYLNPGSQAIRVDNSVHIPGTTKLNSFVINSQDSATGISTRPAQSESNTEWIRMTNPNDFIFQLARIFFIEALQMILWAGSPQQGPSHLKKNCQSANS